MTYDSETFEAHRYAAERAAVAWRAYEYAQAEADELKVEAISAAREYALLMGRPVSSGRRRMSDALAKEIAEVYRSAWAAGQNPTQAVARHFDKPASTAGRWVGEARKRGHLGPADGSRGGERG